MHIFSSIFALPFKPNFDVFLEAKGTNAHFLFQTCCTFLAKFDVFLEAKSTNKKLLPKFYFNLLNSMTGMLYKTIGA